MSRFVRDYLAMLDGRLQRIRQGLAEGHDVDVHVALLSLESSSAMISGGADLARAAGDLRTAVEQGDRAAMPLLWQTVAERSEDFRVHLSA